MKRNLLISIIVVSIFCLCFLGLVWILIGTNAGSRLIVDRFFAFAAPSSAYSIGKVEGSLLKTIVIRDVQIRGRSGTKFPAGLIRISKIDIYFSAPRLKNLNVEIYNARLLLPYGGVVLLNGIYQDEVFEGDLFMRSMAIGDLRRFLQNEKFLKDVDGHLGRLECELKLRRSGAQAQGKAYVSDLTGKNFDFKDGPFSFQVKVSKTAEFTGNLEIYSGHLTLPKSKVEIKPGKVYLEKDAQESRLDLNASSKIEKTKISIVLKGTPKNPELKLTSDPPKSQDRLMLMLLTGKSWQTTEESLGKGEVSADVVKDALSFLFFGSGPEGLAQKLGISDIHLEYTQEKRGVEVETNVLPKTHVTYGVEQNQPDRNQTAAEPQNNIKQKVGVVYDVGEHLSIEGRSDVSGYEEGVTNAEGQTAADQTLYLKYKKQF